MSKRIASFPSAFKSINLTSWLACSEARLLAWTCLSLVQIPMTEVRDFLLWTSNPASKLQFHRVHGFGNILLMWLDSERRNVSSFGIKKRP
jgi:hypothetical protein